MSTVATKIKNVAVYSRKSRPEETNEVLKRQLQTLLDLCVKNDWHYEVFQEVGSSQDINTELDKMLRKVQTYEYDAVVVTEQSRLGRNDLVIAQVKTVLGNYGVKLVTPTQILDLTTQEGTLMSDMQTIVDKQEYLNIKKRLIRGKRQSAKEGNWVGGKTPVGYEYDHKTKKLVPDEYAPNIKRIYDLYLSGKSSTDIERQFELEGILTPTGSRWNKARISVVLANPVYKGTVIYGKTKVSKVEKKPSGKPKQFKVEDKSEQIVIENAHEPIISPEDWAKVEDIREKRNSKPPSARIGKVIFTGLIKCSLCGRVHSFQRRKGKELRVTSCQTRHYKEDGTYTVCQNKGVKLSDFEEVFFAHFGLFVNELEQYLEKIKNNIRTDVANPADEKAHLEASIKKIEANIKRVQKGFIAEIYTEDEAQKEIKALKTQREQLEAQIERLNTKTQDEQLDELETSVVKLRAILEGTSDLETKETNELLCDFINYIEYKRVGDHKAEIELNIHYKGQEQE